MINRIIFIAFALINLLSIPVSSAYFPEAQAEVKLLDTQNNWINGRVQLGQHYFQEISHGLKGIDIKLINLPDWMTINYRLHTAVESGKWTEWQNSKTIETDSPANAIAIMMLDPSHQIDIYYRVMMTDEEENLSWSGWNNMGMPAGDTASDRTITAIQIRLENAFAEQDENVYTMPWERDADGSEPEPDLFDDEEILLAAIEKDPSPANFKKLAQIRFKHAIDYWKLADKNKDATALELANRYLMAATENDPTVPDY